MTSLKFPDTGTRLVVLPSGAPAVNRVGTLYADKAGTSLAEVYADASGVKGALITDGKVTLDAYGQQPDYWGPVAGTDRLYITVNGGPLVPVDADYNARIDAAETPSGAQAKASAAQAAAISAAATDATTKANSAQTAATNASVPRTGGTLTGSVSLTSSAAGGGNTFDSTSRVNLATYQRAVAPNHFGEAVRIDLKTDDAKGMIAWREDYTGNGPRSVAWIGAHGKSNDGLSWHNHISIEVPDLTGALQTALEIPFATWNTANGFGISANDVYIRAIGKLIAGPLGLSVEASGGTSRDLNFGTVDGSNIGGLDAFRRWTFRADSTTEAGSNAGSDFQLVRRSDVGAVLGTAMFTARSTGYTGFGYAGASGGAVSAVWSSTAAHGFYAKPSTTPGNSSAFASLMTVATDRIEDHRVSGDATARLVQFADGKIEWGNGTLTRDTNLYRSAAAVLSTDASFTVGSNFRHFGTGLGFYSAAAATKQAVTGSRGGNAALASLLTALATVGLITDSSTA